MLKLAASQLSVHAVGNLLQNHKRRESEFRRIGVTNPSYKDCYGTRSSEEDTEESGISYRRIGVTNPSYKDVGNLLPKNRGYKPLLQKMSGISYRRIGVTNPSYKDCCGTRSSEESGLQTPPTQENRESPGIGPKNRGYKPLLQRCRESPTEESGLQTPPTKMSGISYRRIGVTNPSYKDRESEFPPTKIGNRSSLLQRLLLFLTSYAFFSQKTAIFCNFKLTRSV